MTSTIEVLFCYSHEDETLLLELQAHLAVLKRQGLIDVWYDREIGAGTEWEREIDEHLDTAQIILLLVTRHFMNSDYCYGIQMKRAIERHERGEAHVIPIILSHVLWREAPFGKLYALPKDAKPVRSWRYRDEAYLDIVEGIYKVVEQLTSKSPASLSVAPSQTQNPELAKPLPEGRKYTTKATAKGHDRVLTATLSAISQLQQFIINSSSANTIKNEKNRNEKKRGVNWLYSIAPFLTAFTEQRNRLTEGSVVSVNVINSIQVTFSGDRLTKAELNIAKELVQFKFPGIAVRDASNQVTLVPNVEEDDEGEFKIQLEASVFEIRETITIVVGHLIVVDSGPSSILPGTRFDLMPQTTIGRGPTNTIQLLDNFISGEHTRLWLRNGTWYVQDAGSTNGTYLNNQPVREALPAKLGDIIQIGFIRFKLIR